MQLKGQAPGEAAATLRGKEVRFIGQPLACVGQLNLTNRSRESARIRRMPFADTQFRGPAALNLRDLPVFARLEPGGSAHVSMILPLPPNTPPGRYTGQAIIGGENKSVIIDVLESWNVAISPTHFSFKVHAGEKPRRVIHLTNQGNMPWNVPRAAFATLQEVDGIHSNLFLSLKNSGAEGYEAVLNDLARRMADTEIESATVKFLSGPEVLQPGEESDFDIELSFARKLKKHRRFTGNMDFEGASLTFEVELVEPRGTH